MEKTKTQNWRLFVTLGIIILVGLATGIPIVAGTWTSDATISVDTVVKKEGNASIKVVSNQSAAAWTNDSSIVSGLTDTNDITRPTIFYMGSKWYLISGELPNGDAFHGYNWTGSTWQSDNAIISGLSAPETSFPYVFYKDSIWYLIYGNQSGQFTGYNWTGSTWQSDSNIVSGLGDVVSKSVPCIFQKGVTWYLISGNQTGEFIGYNWTGSTWQSDNAIISGLSDVGSASSPMVFNKSGTWYLISGEGDGVFNGYSWTGSTWQSDNAIKEGLYDIGAYSFPHVFEGGSDFGGVDWYLIANTWGVLDTGEFIGFNWSDVYTPECYFQKYFSPAISVTNVSKNVGYLALWYYIYNTNNISTNVKVTIYTDDSNYMYWEISKTYFENGWNEVYLPLSEGTESGTLNLGAISRFKLEIPGTEDPYMVHRVDYVRFVEYPYTSHNIYLEPESEAEEGEGVGTYYPPPHLVEFRVQNMYGNPISDLSVTAFGVQTTMGTWDWLYSIFGYKNETQIHNTTMNGTTDVMGHLSFLMIETVKYKIDFVKESEGINETMYFYPKETQYQIILTPTAQPDMIDYLSWNLSVEKIIGDDSNRSLNFTYADSMNKTSQICFFIRDENKTELHSTCSFADNSSVDTGHTVAKSSGVTYYWGFNATHNTFGEIKGTKAITFKSRLIDLQLTNESYYTWISIALLFLITALFSGVTTKFGYVVVPLIASFFVYVQWLEIPATLITVIVILGILLFMGRKERESGL